MFFFFIKKNFLSLCFVFVLNILNFPRERNVKIFSFEHYLIKYKTIS